MLSDYLLLLSSTTDSTTMDITREATRQLNAFQRFWNSINWDELSITLIGKGLYILFLAFLFGLLSKVGRLVIEHTYRSYSKKANLSENRMKTIHTLIINFFQYTLYFFFLYALLSTIGIPVGSLLAGAGIAGVAIGLGAQGFMNDIITGLFIILEKQMDVGDSIQLMNLGIEGTVISIGIRSVQIKSVDGTIHFIPNRNITTISNRSRANMQVVVDVRIKPEEDLEKISEIIQSINDRLAQTHKDDIQTGPTLFGMVDLGSGSFAIRTTMYVVNGQQFKIKEDFLTTYIKELSDAGFTIPAAPIIHAQ